MKSNARMRKYLTMLLLQRLVALQMTAWQHQQQSTRPTTSFTMVVAAAYSMTGKGKWPVYLLLMMMMSVAVAVAAYNITTHFCGETLSTTRRRRRRWWLSRGKYVQMAPALQCHNIPDTTTRWWGTADSWYVGTTMEQGTHVKIHELAPCLFHCPPDALVWLVYLDALFIWCCCCFFYFFGGKKVPFHFPGFIVGFLTMV